MFCPNCGKEIADNEKFCTSCGYQIKEKKPEVKDKTNVVNDILKNNKLMLPIILGCLVLLLIVGIVFFLKSSHNNSHEIVEKSKSKNDIEKSVVVKNQWDGDYYIGDDGEYVKNTWAQYGNDWYYCGEDGKIVKNQWIDDTFYVDDEGKMMLNAFTPDGFFVGEDGKYVEGKTLQSTITSPLLQKAKETINRIDSAFAGSYVCKIDGNGNVYCHANYIDTVYFDERTYKYKRQVYSENPPLLEKEVNDYLLIFYKDVGTIKIYRVYNIIDKTTPTLCYSTFNSPDIVQFTKWNYEGTLDADGGIKYSNYMADLAKFNSIK